MATRAVPDCRFGVLRGTTRRVELVFSVVFTTVLIISFDGNAWVPGFNSVRILFVIYGYIRLYVSACIYCDARPAVSAYTSDMPYNSIMKNINPFPMGNSLAKL